MYVVATAGHVDHGKSALIRALTGMEPDRLAAEQEQGRSIELGYCWTSLDSGARVAFVDVPGHERYLGNALCGLGPSPAVLLVVAADDGVKPQTREHLAAVTALEVRHGVVAVNRSDLADPEPATRDVAALLAETTLAGAPVVAVSARTGAGLDRLRAALDRMLTTLPRPDPAAPTRLWLDRVFTVRGAGTVATGTLVCGEIREGDVLRVARTGAEVTVRGLQCLREAVPQAAATSRVAVNLRRVPADQLRRGDALVDPGRWRPGPVVDVRHRAASLPREVILHLGTCAVTGQVRPFRADTARLRLAEPVPVHVGDRLVLRAPGSRDLFGAVVLDPAPPPLPRRRGAGAARAAELARASGVPDGVDELRRRKVASTAFLASIGVPPPGPPVIGDWHIDPDHAETLRVRLADLAATAPELTATAAAGQLGLPDPKLLAVLLPAGLEIRDGVLRRHGTTGTTGAPWWERLDEALAPLPPEQLQALGVDRAELISAARAGQVVRIGRGYLSAAAIDAAVATLRKLPQPFTVSQARQAWGVSRAVALPLLQHLDSTGVTSRLPDHTRRLRT